MKKLFAIVAVTVAATVWYALPAFAVQGDLSGDMRFRAYMIQAYDLTEDGDKNWLDARFRVTTTVKQGITTGVLQVDFVENGNGVENGNLIFGEGTGGSHDYLGLRQAYLAISFPRYTLIGGKYELKLGNGLVMNDTLDLIAAVIPVGPVNLLVAYAVLEEDDDPFSTVPTGDNVAYVFNADLKSGSWWSLGAFAAFDRVSVSGADPGEYNAYGLTYTGTFGPVRMMAELDLFNGQEVISGEDVKGTNFLLSGALPMNMFDLNAALIYASGQDLDATDEVNINHLDGDFRIGNILGRDDFNNYEGVESIGEVAVDGTTGDGLGLQAIKVALMFHAIQFLGSSHTPEVGLVFAQTTEDDSDGDSDAGTEIYLNTNCVFDKNLSGNIGLAWLSAGDALVTGTTDPEDQLKIELALTYHF